MAIVVQSATTSGFSATNTDLTVGKPTSLAVGDLMVIAYGSYDNTTGVSSGLTGWTQIFSTTSATGAIHQAWYKIADSGDVAGSGWTLTNGNPSAIKAHACIIYRITGHKSATAPVGTAIANTSTTTSPSYTVGRAPTEANSLLILSVIANSAGATQGTTSGYAIATDNPTWTERGDINSATGDNGSFASASAVRTQTSNTGNASLTLSESPSGGTIGSLIVISALNSTAYSLTADLASFLLTGQSLTFTKALRMLSDIGSFLLTGQDLVFRYGRGIVAEVGNYVLTGQAVALRSARTMTAALGEFTLTGVATTLTTARKIVASVGQFVLTGNASRFLKNGTSVLLINIAKVAASLTNTDKTSTSLTNTDKTSTSLTNSDRT